MKTYKHKTNGSSMTYKDGCMKIENLVIEGTPDLDYWEEVVEKEWEILSFLNLANRSVYSENSSGWNCTNSDTGTRSYDYCLKFYKIHSIKRLSDDVVFKISDKIELLGDIVNFKLIDTNILVHGTKASDFLSKVCHIKTLLFITKDGVEIFEGDIFAHTSGWTEPKIKIATPKHLNYKLPMDYLFSTKEKAEEWIILNKPCLSINDVLSIDYDLRGKQSLIKLVKSKL